MSRTLLVSPYSPYSPSLSHHCNICEQVTALKVMYAAVAVVLFAVYVVRVFLLSRGERYTSVV